jgi:predicted esterase
MSRHHALAVALSLLLVGLVGRAVAQTPADRYETGRHLRAFEAALDAQTDPAARRRALGPLKSVAGAFLTGQLPKVADMLDRARLDLSSDKEPEPVQRWAQSVTVTLAARLLDVSAGDVPFTVRTWYKAGERPARFSVRLTLTRADRTVAGPTRFDVTDLPTALRLPLKDVPEGDYILRDEILVDGRVLASGVQGLSLANQLDARLEKLTRATARAPGDKETTDQATLRTLAGLLFELRDRKPQETNYPAVHLLVQAEQTAAALAAGQPYYGQKKPGDFYLILATRTAVAVRLRAPEAVRKGEPLPLVIALHGAGGSENMFFDAHGRGLVADLAAARGWLVVAPRNGLSDDLVDAVDALYPVDRRRVFLIGHSQGAARLVAAVGADPERYAAVAPLSGGGRFKETDKLREVPFFVATGSEDFTAVASRGLAASLEKAGVKKVTFKEYPGLEHLTVVQLALPDVFAFFDEVARGK